jgi:predicted dehydrogenase
VHRADCERLIAAHEAHPELVFAAMFNQRTIKAHIRMKELVAKGELGEIRRINWIVTDWFRTDSYYASGGWRATWAGEGGGVLLNQCPHNLDLLQWITGMMPNQVRAFCNFGKRHEIEVEDEVTAYLEYPNGATGVFITTTGEAPGTNRLEIVGERGKLIFEGQENLKFVRNEVPMGEFCRTAAGGFDKPETWNVEIHADRSGPQHQGITQNFVDAILDGTPLIARAEEGIRSVEIANAMLLSTFLDRTVTLPIDGALYEKELKKRFQTGAAKKKKVVKASESSMASTF